jgi:glutamate-1-semialdehyde 2,1-aminomutase
MNDLRGVVDEYKERYAKANPASAERHRAATAVMPGGNTRTVLHYDPFPLTFIRGQGPYLFSADGVRYVDFLGEFTAGLYGHSEPAILNAIRSTLDSGISFGSTNGLEQRLAALLCDRFPSMELVRFTNSGTEANLLALATATMATARHKILVFEGGYHGSVVSFGGGGSPVNVPHAFIVATYNDTDEAVRLIRDHAPDLAAVLVEPMLGSGGCVPGDPAFLAALRAETEACGALLIFDEVMTSRLAPGGRQATLGIRPDLMTVGKYLGGGMSFGAFGGRRELMERFDPRRPDAAAHAGTFNNNVLTMSAGLAALDLLTPAAITGLSERGEALRAALRTAVAGLPVQVTGIGSVLTFHFAAAPPRNGAEVAAADQGLKELFFFDLVRRGFHLARRGMLALSLAIGDEECAAFVDAVAAFADERRALLARAASD